MNVQVRVSGEGTPVGTHVQNIHYSSTRSDKSEEEIASVNGS
jgi:hypothetical protein